MRSNWVVFLQQLFTNDWGNDRATVDSNEHANVSNSSLPDSRLTLIGVRVNLAHSRVLTWSVVEKQNARSLIRLIMSTRKRRESSRCDRTVQCHFSPSDHRCQLNDLCLSVLRRAPKKNCCRSPFNCRVFADFHHPTMNTHDHRCAPIRYFRIMFHTQLCFIQKTAVTIGLWRNDPHLVYPARRICNVKQNLRNLWTVEGRRVWYTRSILCVSYLARAST